MVLGCAYQSFSIVLWVYLSQMMSFHFPCSGWKWFETKRNKSAHALRFHEGWGHRNNSYSLSPCCWIFYNHYILRTRFDLRFWFCFCFHWPSAQCSVLTSHYHRTLLCLMLAINGSCQMMLYFEKLHSVA